MALSPSRRTRLIARRHTALLAAIITCFAIRPVIGDTGLGSLVFSLAMLLMLLIALYAIELDELVGDPIALHTRRRRRRWLALALALPAVAERLLALAAPSPRHYLAGAVSWLAFASFVTWIELRTVLEQREVTNETISMAISVYLLIGLTWGLLYFAIFQVDPQAFSFEHFAGAQTDPAGRLSAELPIFMYFSLTTLSTIGFGDITPVSLQARYAAVAEGITGQLFLAILVARLVSMQLAGRGDPSRRDERHDGGRQR